VLGDRFAARLGTDKAALEIGFGDFEHTRGLLPAWMTERWAAQLATVVLGPEVEDLVRRVHEEHGVSPRHDARRI
jgi:hypothetical protein